MTKSAPASPTNKSNLKVNVAMFHLMYCRQLNLTPDAYAAKIRDNKTFAKQVKNAYDGWSAAVIALRTQIVGTSKMAIEEIGPGSAKIRIGIGEWDINSTPRSTEEALDQILTSNNFLEITE